MAELERHCEDLEQQVARSPLRDGDDPEVVVTDLSSELARAYSEIEELKNANECLEESIKSLESTLASIERQSNMSGAPPAMVTSAAFSKQIVQFTQAHNEAQRRLKVAARQALDYEQRIAEQAARIQQLKGSSSHTPGRHRSNHSSSAERNTVQRRAVSLSPAVSARCRASGRTVEQTEVNPILGVAMYIAVAGMQAMLCDTSQFHVIVYNGGLDTGTRSSSS